MDVIGICFRSRWPLVIPTRILASVTTGPLWILYTKVLLTSTNIAPNSIQLSWRVVSEPSEVWDAFVLIPTQCMSICLFNAFAIINFIPRLSWYPFLLLHGVYMPHRLPWCVALDALMLLLCAISTFIGIGVALYIFVDPRGYAWVRNLNRETERLYFAQHKTVFPDNPHEAFDRWIRMRQLFTILLFLFL